jgi:transposase
VIPSVMVMRSGGTGCAGRIGEAARCSPMWTSRSGCRRGNPLRVIRCIANDALGSMSGSFDALHASVGRPSIPPEMLLRALLLQAFHGLRSERQLMERLDFDLLFRWFVGLGVDDAVWDASTFSKNCDRLLEGDAAAAFLAAIVAHPKVRRLVSTEHFSVDGTLIEAWASMKSFRPKAEGEDSPDDGAPPPGPGAMPRWTSAASGARTVAIGAPLVRATMATMPRRPTRTRACSARAAGPARCSASWATR